MSKKISEMTPTGEAPATSELAIAYNGANYKINPTALGGGGAITAVYRFKVGYIGNGGAGAAYTAMDGNLPAGKYIGWVFFQNYTGNPGVVSDPFYTTNSLDQGYLKAIISSGAYRPTTPLGAGNDGSNGIAKEGCASYYPIYGLFDLTTQTPANGFWSIGMTWAIPGTTAVGSQYVFSAQLRVFPDGSVTNYTGAGARGLLSFTQAIFAKFD